MATPFTTIYERALFKMKGHELFKLSEENTSKEDIYSVLHMHLLSAQADFESLCETDLNDIDSEMGQYNNDLTNKEIEILALGVRYHYFSYLASNDELFRNSLSTKDYSLYSPANLLKEISSTKEQYYQEYNHKMIDYTYRLDNIATLKA